LPGPLNVTPFLLSASLPVLLSISLCPPERVVILSEAKNLDPSSPEHPPDPIQGSLGRGAMCGCTPGAVYSIFDAGAHLGRTPETGDVPLRAL
ncbi:MAG: hypothetical protein II478_05070, partial [Bacteroidales bacterium]|nr:hypothetical protein [Bacteroidales bacterium]